MAILNLDFILNFNTIDILVFLIIFSFTNGFILLPASQAILIMGGLLVSMKGINFYLVFSLLTISNFSENYLLYFLSYYWGEDTARKILPMRKKHLTITYL